MKTVSCKVGIAPFGGLGGLYRCMHTQKHLNICSGTKRKQIFYFFIFGWGGRGIIILRESSAGATIPLCFTPRQYLSRCWEWLLVVNHPLQTRPVVGFSVPSASSVMTLYRPFPVITAAQISGQLIGLQYPCTVWMVAVQPASLHSAASLDDLSHFNNLVFIRGKFIRLFYILLPYYDCFSIGL